MSSSDISVDVDLQDTTENDPLVPDESITTHHEEPPSTCAENLRKPHFLWMILFSISLSTIITSTIAPLDIKCWEYYSENTTFSSRLPREEDCKMPEVLALAAGCLKLYQMVSYFAAFLSIGYLSTLSDYKGRRFIFKLSIIGIMIAYSNIIFVYYYWRIVSSKFLFLGAMIEGLSGGIIAINTACHAYLSDCTKPENRSVAFGFMHAFAFCGMTIGPTLGGYIIKKNAESVISLFYIVLCGLVLFLFFVTLILPESLSKELRLRRYESSSLSTTSPRQLYSSLTILTQPPVNVREGSSWRGRNALYILSTIYLIYRLSQAGQNDIIVLYTADKFHWSFLENGYFLSLQAFTRFTALILLLPLCRVLQSRYLSSNSRALDIFMMRIGLTMEVVGFALFAIAPTPNMFYFACVINSLATLASPAIRSLFTTFVLPTQAGQILGALSVIESVGSVLSPFWMNSLYSWSVREGFSESVFWANSILFVVSTFLAFFIL
ncbi:14104_t:CDS:2 [Acaulospora morrowiae]|uniref:14104_t:CDS:1 n=1 Tax=Acaulospora morrowiae TaxID=94023 RepID=A0A9N8VT54_9GLOM|nr:14104_t:CDS:2 [Acaulospora morrowiae]